MDFAFFGYDYSIHAAHRLEAEGHSCLAVFSFETADGEGGGQMLSRASEAFARDRTTPFITEPPAPGYLQDLEEGGCRLFLSFGYPYKIPVVNNWERSFGINIHPTLLPEGRGILPMPYLIMHHRDKAGITIHKLSDDFDRGAILMQEDITLEEREDVDTLSARIALRAPDMIARLTQDPDAYWNNARHQSGTGSHWPRPDDRMRTIDWGEPVQVIDRQGRAFGRAGVIAVLNGMTFLCPSVKIWQETHTHTAGTPLWQNNNDVLVAGQNGLVLLKDCVQVEAVA